MITSRELTAPELVAAWDGLTRGVEVSPLVEQQLRLERFRQSAEYIDLGCRFLAVRGSVEEDEGLIDELAEIFSIMASGAVAIALFRDGRRHAKQIIFVASEFSVVADIRATGMVFTTASSDELTRRTRAFFDGLTGADRAYIETWGVDGSHAGIAWSGPSIRVLTEQGWRDDDPAAIAVAAEWLRVTMEAVADA